MYKKATRQLDVVTGGPVKLWRPWLREDLKNMLVKGGAGWDAEIDRLGALNLLDTNRSPGFAAMNHMCTYMHWQEVYVICLRWGI